MLTTKVLLIIPLMVTVIAELNNDTVYYEWPNQGDAQTMYQMMWPVWTMPLEDPIPMASVPYVAEPLPVPAIDPQTFVAPEQPFIYQPPSYDSTMSFQPMPSYAAAPAIFPVQLSNPAQLIPNAPTANLQLESQYLYSQTEPVNPLPPADQQPVLTVEPKPALVNAPATFLAPVQDPFYNPPSYGPVRPMTSYVTRAAVFPEQSSNREQLPPKAPTATLIPCDPVPSEKLQTEQRPQPEPQYLHPQQKLENPFSPVYRQPVLNKQPKPDMVKAPTTFAAPVQSPAYKPQSYRPVRPPPTYGVRPALPAPYSNPIPVQPTSPTAILIPCEPIPAKELQTKQRHVEPQPEPADYQPVLFKQPKPAPVNAPTTFAAPVQSPAYRPHSYRPVRPLPTHVARPALPLQRLNPEPVQSTSPTATLNSYNPIPAKELQTEQRPVEPQPEPADYQPILIKQHKPALVNAPTTSVAPVRNPPYRPHLYRPVRPLPTYIARPALPEQRSNPGPVPPTSSTGTLILCEPIPAKELQTEERPVESHAESADYKPVLTKQVKPALVNAPKTFVAPVQNPAYRPYSYKPVRPVPTYVARPALPVQHSSPKPLPQTSPTETLIPCEPIPTKELQNEQRPIEPQVKSHYLYIQTKPGKSHPLADQQPGISKHLKPSPVNTPATFVVPVQIRSRKIPIYKAPSHRPVRPPFLSNVARTAFSLLPNSSDPKPVSPTSPTAMAILCAPKIPAVTSSPQYFLQPKTKNPNPPLDAHQDNLPPKVTYTQYPIMETKADPISVPSLVTESIVVKSRPKQEPTNKPIYIYDDVMGFDCRNENGYYPDPHKYDGYIKCEENIPIKYTCPSGFLFNPAANWNEYPCIYTSELKYSASNEIQNLEPIYQCPRSYGFFAIQDEYNKYLFCQNGIAAVKDCPNGLVFIAEKGSCDQPKNVSDVAASYQFTVDARED